MKTLDISQVDALFSNRSYPIEFLFFYRNTIDTERLRQALRRLAPSFWPVFGDYRDGTISFESYQEEDHFSEQDDGQQLDIEKLRADEKQTYSRFRSPALERLFFLRVIRFRNGTVLIPKLNHLAGDGYSYFFFLTALATLARPTLVPFKSSLTKSLYAPRHCRTALREFSFRNVRLEAVSPPSTFTMEYDLITREEVQSIIRDAASSGGLRISTNDILSALAMKKLVGRNGLSWGEKVNLTVPIDVRRHVGEFGLRFFGNAIQLHTLPLEKAALEEASVREIALEIRRSIPAVTKGTYIDYLTGLEKILAEGCLDRFRPFDPDSGCLVTNLSRLPVDRLDFGTGPPDFIFPLTIGRNSAGILADGKNFILRFVF